MTRRSPRFQITTFGGARACGQAAAAKTRFRPDGVISWDRRPAQGNVIMADALLRPIAEIAVLLGEGKLKARDLVEAAIANHERFGGKLMAYSQWAPAHARQCADAADAAFAVGSRAGPLQGHSDLDQGPVRGLRLSDLCRLAQAPATEIRNRRPNGHGSAPAIGDGDGQDAHGRIRFRRHWSQRALRHPIQSLGRGRASLARRLIERRRRFAVRRLGFVGFWQRYRGFGARAPARGDERQCRLENHQGSLVDRRHRATELHLRHARNPDAQHG
jgi:hypothetical protein